MVAGIKGFNKVQSENSPLGSDEAANAGMFLVRSRSRE